MGDVHNSDVRRDTDHNRSTDCHGVVCGTEVGHENDCWPRQRWRGCVADFGFLFGATDKQNAGKQKPMKNTNSDSLSQCFPRFSGLLPA
jgi:hypothetical protein